MRLGTCDRKDLISSGIKCRSDSLDIAALACRIPSFICNDDRDFPAVEFIVQFTQLSLQAVQFFLVFLIG